MHQAGSLSDSVPYFLAQARCSPNSLSSKEIMMPVHKSKAITYITPAARAEAVKEQNLVIQGKGKLLRGAGVREPLGGPAFAIDSRPAGSFDEDQAVKNKELGYW
jgi:hypothetical protein